MVDARLSKNAQSSNTPLTQSRYFLALELTIFALPQRNKRCPWPSSGNANYHRTYKFETITYVPVKYGTLLHVYVEY